MRIKGFFKKKRNIAVVAVLVLALAGSAFLGGGQNDPQDAEEQAARTVTVLALSEADGNGTTVTASGNVRAAEEADLVAETSGVVRTVHVRIGDSVARGQALITLSNADAAAAVAQARAGLDAALSSAESAETGVGNAEEALRDAVENAARTIDDVRGTKVSQLFSDSDDLEGFGVTWRQGGTTYGIEAGTSASAIRQAAQAAVRAQEELEAELATGGNAEEAVDLAEDALEAMRTLLAVIAERVNQYTSGSSADQAVYDRFQGDISAGRASVAGSISALRGAMQAYRSAEVRDTDPAIDQARAALQAAEAQLAKTVIRAPFAGRVLSVSPTAGEFLGMGTPAVSLLSTSGKEITLYLDANDAASVDVGSRIAIASGAEGSVIRKAPGIDEATGKIEVIASLSNDAPVAIGEFVHVTIAASGSGAEGTRIPLRAVRMTNTGAQVFVIEEGTAVARPVETGAIEGEYVVVVSGLEGIDSIIANVRGITAGDEVTVAES